MAQIKSEIYIDDTSGQRYVRQYLSGKDSATGEPTEINISGSAAHVAGVGISSTPQTVTKTVTTTTPVKFTFDPPIKVTHIIALEAVAGTNNNAAGYVYCLDPSSAAVAAGWLNESNDGMPRNKNSKHVVDYFDGALVSDIYVKAVDDGAGAAQFVVSITGGL